MPSEDIGRGVHVHSDKITVSPASGVPTRRFVGVDLDDGTSRDASFEYHPDRQTYTLDAITNPAGALDVFTQSDVTVLQQVAEYIEDQSDHHVDVELFVGVDEV